MVKMGRPTSPKSTYTPWLRAPYLAVLYAVGLPYMALILNGYMGKGLPFAAVMKKGMLPFLPGDALKILVTALLCPILRRRVSFGAD